MLNPVDKRQQELLPVVHYAVKRRLELKNVDYWDHATLLELSIISRDKNTASKSLSDALIAIREKWEPKTTANNIRMIIDARNQRGEDTKWVEEIEDELLSASNNY